MSNRAVALLLSLLLVLSGCGERQPPRQTIDLEQVLGPAQGDYPRALNPRRFHFPADHGPHPRFRNEWWFVTGHLRDQQGRLYGYQVTFFRFAISPTRPDTTSAWATNQLWMAHAALTHVEQDTHREVQRFARGALALAGAESPPFRVWLGDWQLRATGAGDQPWLLTLDAGTFSLDLSLLPERPVVLQGDRGLSQKSEEPGNASYYYSITRLPTTGRLTVDGQQRRVSGASWLDREWGTSALSPQQSGWDWFSLQLDDGRDLMFYRLRTRNGDMHPASRGSLADSGGKVRNIDPRELTLTPLEWWRADSGRRYPVHWRVQSPSLGADWEIRALVTDQEMTLAVIYWEGLVEVIDRATGKRIGLGYLEMSGY